MTNLEQSFVLPDGYAAGQRTVEPAPAHLVEDGRLHLGFFRTPPRRMNLVEARLLGGRTRSWWGAPRLMEWVGCGIPHPRWYLAVIVVNAQSASLCVVYGVDRRSGERFTHRRLSRPSHARVAETTWCDETWFREPGCTVEWEHRLDDGYHRLRMDLQGRGPRPPVRGELRCGEDLRTFDPFVSCVPVGPRQFVFGHKAQMPLEGRLRVGDEELLFDPGRDVANLDEFKACNPLHNRYTWVTLGGIDEGGRIQGFNAMNNTHRLDDYWHENCLWAGGRLSLLDACRFEIDPRNLDGPWTVTEVQGRAAVELQPQGGLRVRARPFVDYHQKCGPFHGTLVDPRGERHPLIDAVGCGEHVRAF